MANSNRILVKLRSSVALAAAAPHANLRLLFEPAAPTGVLGVAAAPARYIADLPDGGPTPWDIAHARVADQLGIAASDVLFAEPDLPQSYATANEGSYPNQPFAMGQDCNDEPQTADGGRATGPGFAWHLQDDFSQLALARARVPFADPRTRIAHIDTGYDTLRVRSGSSKISSVILLTAMISQTALKIRTGVICSSAALAC